LPGIGETGTNITKLDALIAGRLQSGGSEFANYQRFVIGLFEALGLDRPNLAQEQNELNGYVFEHGVDIPMRRGWQEGSTATGRAGKRAAEAGCRGTPEVGVIAELRSASAIRQIAERWKRNRCQCSGQLLSKNDG
jgi:hypothetical protein